MSQAVRKVDFISIDCDSNYFDTKEQINLRSRFYFSDRYIATKISGSSTSTGHFSNIKKKLDKQTSSNNPYPLQDTVVDASGNARKILSLDIDIYASGSVDTYRNGVEITQEKHWTAGLSKISAGTPGHLYDGYRYGIADIETLEYINIPNTSSVDSSGNQREFLTGDVSDKLYTDSSGNQRKIFLDGRPSSIYTELDAFDPVKYVDVGGDPSYFTFPIITKNSNEAENYTLNGIIEPFPIRSVVSNYSINFPFEPHATRGEFGNGNTDESFASDVVNSIDYFTPKVPNKSFFLDAVDRMSISSNSTASITIGVYIGYLNLDKNSIPAYKEELNPRGVSTDSYDSDFKSVVDQFSFGGTTYVTDLQKSATCGYAFETDGPGVDSIAYGDIAYGSNRDNRRRKRNIMRLREADSFIKNNVGFNDTDTINFTSQTIEYPSMLPANYAGSMMNSTIRSEVYKTGAIQVTGSLLPGNYDLILLDSILSAKKRLGDF